MHHTQIEMLSGSLHAETLSLIITNYPYTPIILGSPWLTAHGFVVPSLLKMWISLLLFYPDRKPEIPEPFPDLAEVFN